MKIQIEGRRISNLLSPHNSGKNQAIKVVPPNMKTGIKYPLHPNLKSRDCLRKSLIECFSLCKQYSAPDNGPNVPVTNRESVIVVLQMAGQGKTDRIIGIRIQNPQDQIYVTKKNL